MSWFVYIIECKDRKLYTGISNNLERRIKEHNGGYGCIFTKYRRPVKLVHSEGWQSLKEAMWREAEIKRFSRQKKLKLIVR